MNAKRFAMLAVVALVAAVILTSGGAPTVHAATVITVKPSALNGWGFLEEVATGTGSFVNGPATPPLGTGSTRLTVDATGRMILGTQTYAGTRLDQITRLQYSTYRSSADVGNILAISLQFDIDYDLTDANTAWQGRLVFEPYQTVGGTVGQNSWQTWNPLTGKWWASGAPGNSLCPQSSPCTYTEVLTNWPNTGLRSNNGFLWFKAGGPWSSGFDGNVDAFTIGVNGVETTYDFEPETLCTTTCYVNAATGNDAFGGDTPGSAKKTIQAAVNQVLAGGTVIVAAGTYNESVVIDKSLTLQSSTGAASTIINGNSATENYYMVSIEADNVTLDGFTITNPLYNASADASGVVTNLGKSSIRITNNIIHDIGTSTRSPVSFGTFGINVGPVNGLEIDHNTIYSIKNSDASSSAMGIFVWGNNTTDTAKNINIHDNVIHDITNPSDFNDGINAGGDSANVVISNNTISAPIKRGIATNAFMDGDASITNNLVSGASSYGILLHSPFAQSVTCNTVTGSGIGIQVNDTSAAPTINYNNIVGNTTWGLNNLSNNMVNAENNWWGAADGPSGAGDAVSDNVDFEPFRTSPSTCAPGDFEGPITSKVVATPNPVPMGGSVTLTAKVDDSTTGYSTITSAEYSIDGGVNWTSMSASDGTFDAISEEVVANIGPFPEPAVIEVCVRGKDAASNTGPKECILLAIFDPDAGFVTGGGWIESPPGAYKQPVWSQGFETDTSGWFDSSNDWSGTITRVPSGTSAISSSSGSYHAVIQGDASSAPFTRFDGYRDTWPGTWRAEIDVYLNPAWGAGQGFDYSVAATGTDGNHQRDFIFHVTKDTSTGKLLVAGSNNTNFAPREDLEGINHYEVTTAGWYTFQHVFYDDGGVLAVDLNLLDSNGTILFTETRRDASDTIPGEVGGNRYGWFTFVNVTNGIAVDNHELFLSTSGKATFGFVSKYQKGANAPSGQTEFQFKAGNLNFHSSSYEWLVVNQNDSNAQFKGSGTINGELAPNGDDYKFMLWAGDGSPDTFRIKIWWEDTNGEHVVYDNGVQQPIGGGSIVIHKK